MYQILAGSIIRGILPFIGGLVASDKVQLVDDSQIDQLAGAVVMIGSIVWSIIQKLKTQRVTNTLAQHARMPVAQAKMMVESPDIPTPSAFISETVVPTSEPGKV